MYLEKIKILGFKSFAKKTVLNFTEGTTGIVGPNGCGKSNIVDAIRWVLGEQRAGTLRSDRMENVIFNGTKDVKPLGMAEVSLVVKNTKNVLPVEYSEVVITRRLFRSGESQYLLNNSVCRLKDIVDLLMDTGMAADAYSVIELKMVEQILSGRLDERRRIFEEAAGIKKYKQRRHITTRKLDSTQGDLVRIADIYTEVESKVNSLKRQVRRAERYQELTAQLRTTELNTATFRYNKIYEELEPLTARLEEIQRTRESSTAQISFKEADVEALRTKIIEIEQKLRSSQRELNAANDLIRKKEEEILVSRERVKSLTQNNERIEIEIQQLQNRVIDETKKGKQLSGEIENLAKSVESSDAKYKTEKSELEKVEKEFKKKQEAGKQSSLAMRKFLENMSGLQGNIEHLKGSLQYLHNRIKELEAEKQAITGKLTSQTNELEQQQHQEEIESAKLEKLVEDQDELTRQSESVSGSIEAIKEDIIKNNSRLDTLKQRIAILNKLLESYSDYPDGVKYVMTQSQDYVGTIADIISVPNQYQQALETVLGEAATYLIVENDEQAFLEIKSLKDSEKGIVTFLPLNNFLHNNNLRPVLNISHSNDQVIGWADEIMECDVKYQPLLKTLLNDYLIIKDFSILESNPDLRNSDTINFVTLSGELITKWGGIKGGRKSHDDTSFIGRRDQLKLLQQQVDDIYVSNQKKEEEKQNAINQHQSIIARRSEMQQEIKTKEKLVAELRVAVSQLQARIDQSNERILVVDKELVNLQRNIEETEHKINDTNKELEELKQQRVAADGDLSTLNSDLEKLDLDREKLAQVVHQLNLECVQFKNDLKIARTESERCQLFITESNASVKKKYSEIAENENTYDHINERIEELTASLVEDYSHREKNENIVSALEDELNNYKMESDEREKVIRELRRERETSSETIHNIELRIAELKLSADNLFRRINEEHDVELKREPIDEEFDLKNAEEETDRIKERLKNLGPVNLLALKEYASEKERLDFLNKQQTDLLEAKHNLEETIAQINKTARDRFMEVFEQIRKNFSYVFSKYFPDGEADLRLADDADALEADIEIMANPKGKHPTTLTLLSGGEKALTAISLLFAIYLVKPSPFCILDEVDAPLDDRNIERFTNTLGEFSQSTQFLIVTHNKLTMKAADCLYGITMESPGVSQVVSVKMD